MSDGALRIPITGDASQFKATLSEVESSLKYFKEKLKSAKGDQIGKINFTISGLEETKNALTTFGKFADGTLGQLYQKLEQLKSLRLTIQADATALTPVNNAIDETTKKIKDLLNAGLQKPIVEAAQVSANSIQGLKNRIDELNQKKFNLDAKDDYLQIVKLNQEIDRLKTQINNLNKLGLKVDQTIDPAVNSFRNLTNTSNKSRQALTSLSLVAQDLPFGFIAIQNNLPAVIQTFGQLKAESTTIKGTLSALASGLVGPAGLFLAFSVVTGAVTYAIQKYGSLGAALDRLTGSYFELGEVANNAVKSLQEYNKNLKTTSEITSKAEASEAGRVIQIRALSSAVLDLNKSDFERKKALDALKKLDEERFKNFDIEKGNLDKLRQATEDYTRAIISEAVAAKFRDQVSQTSLELENQRLRLKDLIRQLDEVEKKYPNVAKQAKNYLDLISTPIAGQEGAVAEGPGVRAFLKLSEAIKVAEGDIVTVRTQLENFNTAAFNATQTASTLASSIKDTGDKAAGAGKKVKEYKEELSKVVPLFDMFQIKEKKTKQGLFFDFLEGLFSKNDLNQLKEAYKRLQDTQKELDKFREKTPQLPDVTPRVTLSPLSREMAISREEMIKDFENTKIILDEVFFAPLSDLFQNFFDTGKFAFEDFGKSILNTIKSLVSKIIATGIINLLANILLPGSGVAANFAGSASTGAGGGILGAFGAAFKSVLGIGKIANPNFGGVQGGGMQLAGEVVFRQRGSDLIGVINRTNGTINRVG